MANARTMDDVMADQQSDTTRAATNGELLPMIPRVRHDIFVAMAILIRLAVGR
jgi:hypothetical protein